MLTEFGKFTRKLRIEHVELLKDMADKLNVSSSYLSAVEVGKRPVPKKWLNQIRNIYSLSNADYTELLNAADESREEVILNLANRGNKDQDLILSFARKFDSLQDFEKEQIKKILK
ncbi:helix-turn-helix domain-containing protein [Paratissierella segnis]|uniref:Helix-turn-helix transcriptional regulator n=1 Tax=Paratissierella segnis TaxID=2763679 RepID=A0A926EUU0_9FIRM|nr:helix-turn-helix domain-containing protein [Paratissierella segnis]MBC8589316.1 helix-turn-helix transcriptional regulator [Paratissierella segnis]